MAAGLGTRLKPFSDLIPKPLLPVMGVECIRFCLERLVAGGVNRAVINIHHHPAQMSDALTRMSAEYASRGLEIEISDESELLLGSAGGIRKALDRLGERPFLWMNGDVLCDADVAALYRAHEILSSRPVSVSRPHLMTLYVLPRGPGAGKYREMVFESESSMEMGEYRRLKAIGDLVRGRPFFASAAVLDPRAVVRLKPGAPADMLEEVMRPLVASGQVGVWAPSGGNRAFWQDVGSPELWLEAHVQLISRLETGGICREWRQMIESRAQRLAPGIWIGKQSSIPRPDAAEWAGPVYWSGPRQIAPQKLGPRAVVYGSDGKHELGSRQEGFITLGGVARP